MALTNRELIERCNQLTAELSRKNREITALKAKIETLRAESELGAKPVCGEPESSGGPEINVSERRGICRGNTDLPEEITVGAAMIGKLVVKAAEFSNRLTVGGETKYRELVNLILGRAEVAKARIYEIAVSAGELSERAALMERCCAEAEDYFESVMSQRGDGTK